jgi:hypothetical protein
MLCTIWLLPQVPSALLVASLVFPAYYIGLSLFLDRRRRRGLTAAR